MHTHTLLGYYAEYLNRHLPRFGIQAEDAMAQLRDLIDVQSYKQETHDRLLHHVDKISKGVQH